MPFGFSNDPVGTHGSRTMILPDLRLVLATCPHPGPIDDIRSAIVDDNVLGKRTVTTRKEAFRRLRELYALSDDVLLFRVLRELWCVDSEAQPLIALLCAAARDPILRATADLILDTPEGDLMTPQRISDAAAKVFPNRYNPTSLANIGRHAASSWQQSGHLKGRLVKHRSRANARPMAVVYAALLAYLCGARGDLVLSSFWVRMLDTPEHAIRAMLDSAARQGYLDYRSGGGVTEIGFRVLLQGVTIEP